MAWEYWRHIPTQAQSPQQYWGEINWPQAFKKISVQLLASTHLTKLSLQWPHNDKRYRLYRISSENLLKNQKTLEASDLNNDIHLEDFQSYYIVLLQMFNFQQKFKL